MAPPEPTRRPTRFVAVGHRDTAAGTADVTAIGTTEDAPEDTRGFGGGARRARPRGDAPARTERCRWCGRAFVAHAGRGRPRQFCRPGCRQQAYLSRRLAGAHGLGDADVIVDREALEELQSRLYCLQAALEDVDRDLAASAEPTDLADALGWLIENARPLAESWIEPRTAPVGADVGAVADVGSGR